MARAPLGWRLAVLTLFPPLPHRTPEQCPSVVSLLAESYNPHVRYGAAMALGIACAGTGNKEAIALLEPMTNDPVNFVRQGSLIASAMVLIQQTEAACPKVRRRSGCHRRLLCNCPICGEATRAMCVLRWDKLMVGSVLIGGVLRRRSGANRVLNGLSCCR